MNIKTKYQPGDIVFYLYNSKVVQEKVHSITIFIEQGYERPHKVSIKYKFGYGSNEPTLSESEIYPSLTLLKKNIIVNKSK